MPAPATKEPERGPSSFGREVLRSAFVGVVAAPISAGIIAVLTLVALLVFAGGSVPAWLLVLAVVIGVAISLVTHRRDAPDLHFVTDALERGDAYARHLELVLGDLQRVVAGALGAELNDFINRGLLEPARQVLTQQPDEGVRLSVLMPNPADGERWVMRWSAGHSLTGEHSYNQPIKETLSRYAFESGESQRWDDVSEDRAFKQNEAASTPTRSMISVPLRRGDQVVGVFNAIAAVTDVFDPAEERYVGALGGVLAVAVGYFLGQEDASASQNHLDDQG